MTCASRPAGKSATKKSVRGLAALAGVVALAMSAAPLAAAEMEEGAHEAGATAHYPINKPELESWTFAGFFARSARLATA